MPEPTIYDFRLDTWTPQALPMARQEQADAPEAVDEAVVHETGELIGTVIRVGGKDETVPLWLQDTDGTLYPCNTSRIIARELAQHLFGDLVRVQGAGKWRRNPERRWELDDFKIKSWELLSQTSLAGEVAALRAVEGSDWNALTDPQAALKKLREA